MKLRVKRDHTAYVHERRYREGSIVDVPDKLLKKATAASIEELEKQLLRSVGPDEAKKHGLKPGALILPKWAELPSKPQSPEPTLPGVKSTPSGKPKGQAGEGDEAAAGEGDDQSVL